LARLAVCSLLCECSCLSRLSSVICAAPIQLPPLASGANACTMTKGSWYLAQLLLHCD
jgi:hypothetical protein